MDGDNNTLEKQPTSLDRFKYYSVPFRSGEVLVGALQVR